jgi:hypothetical protein
VSAPGFPPKAPARSTRLTHTAVGGRPLRASQTVALFDIPQWKGHRNPRRWPFARPGATGPVFTINGLKREKLITWNAMILHDLYFAGLEAAPSTGLAQALERDLGSHDCWVAEFSAIGKALGGAVPGGCS